jgi:type VI secretion system protein VasG
VLGRTVWDCQHKFRLVIGPLDYDDYQRMLPGGDSMSRLLAWVRNYAGMVLDWDVRLILEQEQVPRLALGGSPPGLDHLSIERARKARFRPTVDQPDSLRRLTHAKDLIMAEISRVALFGKLNSLCYRAIESSTVFCKLRGNPYVEMIHWVHQILQLQDSDLHRIIRHYELDGAVLARDLTAALDRLPRGATSVTDSRRSWRKRSSARGCTAP